MDLPFVPDSLPENSNGWLVLGEAPGAEEVRLGCPFVGRSGQLLDRALAAAGLVRAETMVVNVFRWQPPRNNIEHFFLSRRAATVASEDLDHTLGVRGGKGCLVRYATEPRRLPALIADLRPRGILTLGRTALWAMTGYDRLAERVGKIMTWPHAHHPPLMPTWHPSFLLRGKHGLFPLWVEHMREMIKTGKNP